MPWKKGQKLKFVHENDAPPPVADIFADHKQALGVPLVHASYRAYAAFPKFLEMHWQAVRPAVERRELFQLGERLRADAFTRMHSYFTLPDLCHDLEDMRFSEGARRELTEVADLFHYYDALLMLILSAQLQAFDTRTGALPRVAAPAPPLPYRFEHAPVRVGEESAPGPIRKLYDDIKRTLALPFVNTEYQAFARWPDFLAAYWKVMRPIVQSPLYAECQYAVRETAWALAREFPQPLELSVSRLTDADISDDDVATIVRITELFVKNFSCLLLNVAAAKIGLEGGTQAPAHEASPTRAA